MKHRVFYSFISILLCLLLAAPMAAGALTRDDIESLDQMRKELEEKQQAAQEKIDSLVESKANVIELKAALVEESDGRKLIIGVSIADKRQG